MGKSMKHRIPSRIPDDLSLGGIAPPIDAGFLFDIYFYDQDEAIDVIDSGVLVSNSFIFDWLSSAGLIGSGIIQTQVQMNTIGSIGSGIVKEQVQVSTIDLIGNGVVQEQLQVSKVDAIGSGSVQPIGQASATGSIGSGTVILSETSYD